MTRPTDEQIAYAEGVLAELVRLHNESINVDFTSEIERRVIAHEFAEKIGRKLAYAIAIQTVQNWLLAADTAVALATGTEKRQRLFIDFDPALQIQARIPEGYEHPFSEE